MKTLRCLSRCLLLAFAAAALASSAVEAGQTDQALALVPVDAASVGVVRLDELRASPLAAKLFEDTDHLTADGDAARFLEEAGLRPKQDVDTVVVAAVPGGEGGSHSSTLVLFEGRFDPPRLAAAVTSRGGILKTTPHGDYYKVHPECEGGESRGAIAFVSRRLVIAGDEETVVRALSDRARGGSGFLSGAGLGRHLFRIEGDASAWALVDAVRYPFARKRRTEGDGPGSGEPAAALASAMKSVSLFAFQATAGRNSLDLSATGLTEDEETRGLLEDALRGVLAMWRLSVAEKSPELVSVLRRFKVKSDDEGVTISGTLPGSALRFLAERSETGHESR